MTPIHYLQKLKRKYLAIRSVEIIFFAIAGGSLAYGVMSSFQSNTVLSVIISIATGFTILTIRVLVLKLHKLDEKRLVTFINRQYPELQQSTDLLLRNSEELTSLQQLQQKRISNEFASVYPTIKLPHQIGQATFLLSVSLVVTLVLTSFVHYNSKVLINKTGLINKSKISAIAKLPAAVKEIQIKVAPPLYTGKQYYSTKDANLTIPEASQVSWRIAFTDNVSEIQLVFSGSESIRPIRENNFLRTFTKSTFYQIRWKTLSGEIKNSDYYKIEVVADNAPDIAVHQLAQFTQVEFSEKILIDVKSTITDDFGVKDAYIIATVSKGSGESVKFREEKLLFTSPQKLQGQNITASRTIDLPKLGLEPGDELYFYVEALDTKSPQPNRSRTETFFIAIKDTASVQLSVEGGLGVDLMPEYFRSQRQIIIDSEKLLRDRKNISKHEFNSRSNELGYDQKVLRLKYGEFLGEEFETAIGPLDGLPTDDQPHVDGEKEEDPKEKYGHVHDKENEHNLVPEKQPAHNHKNDINLDPEKKENIEDAYKHDHDNAEEATFFNQSVRSKLKAALTVMWEAELHLRMYDPEKSLPYQYIALKILKEISNDSRIYVHKTGFDPPPLKEERRLSGDLSEIKNTRHKSDASREEIYPEIKRALAMIEDQLQHSKQPLTTKNKETLLRAGNELSALALEQPGRFLQTLSQIKNLSEDQITKDETKLTLLKVRKALWQALPKETISPDRNIQSQHDLDQKFIKNLEVLKNE